jgi:hypothetical protein
MMVGTAVYAWDSTVPHSGPGLSVHLHSPEMGSRQIRHASTPQ